MPDLTHNLPIHPAQGTAPAPGRECGSCSLCCKLFPVPEIGKPGNTWCTNFAKHRGCTIWQHRPAVCRVFWCGWIKGFGPDAPELGRPDHVGFILHGATDGSNAFCISFESATEVPPDWLALLVEVLNAAGEEVRVHIISTGAEWSYPAGTATHESVAAAHEVKHKLGLVK